MTILTVFHIVKLKTLLHQTRHYFMYINHGVGFSMANIVSSGSRGSGGPAPLAPKSEHTFCTAWLPSLGVHPSRFKVAPPTKSWIRY